MISNITTGADFGGLVDYLVENRDHELLDMRGVSSVALAAEEMAAVAALSNRAKVKLVHLSLSAAHEDGELSSDRWLHAVDRHEHAFGLESHQRVVVRHKDKTHDHVHVFWCTISVETGQTPPKRWFLRKGFAVDGIGPQALTDEQVARVPAEHRARRTYDFILLRRAQHLCRQLERELGLRELRSPEQAAAARLAGEERAPSSGQQKRAERTGSAPLTDRSDQIRAALDAPDWPSKRLALAAIGLDLEPVFRTTKKGDELRGLVIIERADPGNRMKASQLDNAALKYGWRKLEERHAPGAATLGMWWREREALPFAPESQRSNEATVPKDQFDSVLERHRLFELEKRAELKQLRAQQKVAVRAKRRKLMQERAVLADKLAPRERREFYRRFDAEVRAPSLADLAERHAEKAAPLLRSRQPTWQEFVQVRGPAIDNKPHRRVVDEVVRGSVVVRELVVPDLGPVQGREPNFVYATLEPPIQSSSAAELSPEVILEAIRNRRAQQR